MTGQDILDTFYLQVGDEAELSSAEALALANEIYHEVCDDRPWEFLKTPYTGTTSVSVPYIALPADFKMVMPNSKGESVVFVGTDYQEYKIIPYSSRRDYRDQDGFCYIDIPNSRLYFTLQPVSAEAVEYDYVKVPDDLTTATSPIFRTAHHKVIYLGMAARFPAIEQAEKADSYRRENKEDYKSVLGDMAVEDANIKLAYA